MVSEHESRVYPSVARLSTWVVEGCGAGADVSRRMVPSNIVQAAAESNILGVIVATVATGVALAHGPPQHTAAAAKAVAVAEGATTRMVRAGRCDAMEGGGEQLSQV
jgi:Na+/H+-dicarboxylate symporter